MSSPIMDNNPYFRQGAVTPNREANPTSAYPDLAVPDASVQVAEYDYANPFDQNQEGYYPTQTVQTMTYNDALQKTGILLGVTVVSGIVAWALVKNHLELLNPLAIGSSLVALVVSFIAARQKMVKPALAILFSVLEGVALGIVTGAFNEYLKSGIAFQAILGTVIVVGVAAALHFSGKVRTTSRGRRIVLTLLLAAIVYALVDMVLVMTGVLKQSVDLIPVGGVPIGIIFGLILIVAAGYALIGDLELIRNAELNGAPKEFAWTCGYGLILSIIWIYIEVLRILVILASDR